MAQPASLDRSLPDLGGPFLYRDQDQDGENSSYSLETPYGFLLDLDFLKYVEEIERGQTLRKVPLSRRAKGPRGQAGGWTSTESLSSVTSEDGKPAFSPRERTGTSSGEIKEAASKQPFLPSSPSPVLLQLLPPPSSKALMRNTRVEKTLKETSKRLEQQEERKVATSPPPASIPLLGEEPGNTDGPVKRSPSHSGNSTPATALSPAHLQHVREQMAAALQRLKGLEEQVKVIPVLEQTICRLRREKEELTAGRREKLDPSEEEEEDATGVFCFPPRSPRAGALVKTEEGSQDRCDGTPAEEGEAEGPPKTRSSKIAGLKKLTEKLSGSEKVGKAGRGASGPPKAREPARRSVGVGEEVDMNEAVFYYRFQKPCREVAVGREAETRDAEVWVMESLLGVSSEAEEERELLQQTVQHQKEVISLLEGHLREATEEMEELRQEVCARRPKDLICREAEARPEMRDASTEATLCQAVNSHVETSDVAVHCAPQVACVGVGCHRWREGCGEKATQTDLENESPASGGEAKAEPGQEVSSGVSSGPGEAVAGPGSRPEEGQGTQRAERMEVSQSELNIPQQKPETGPTQTPGTGALKSIMKKQDSSAKGEAGSGRKMLQFVGVLNGEYESTSSEEEEEAVSPEKMSPLSSDSDSGSNTSEEEDDDDLAAKPEPSDLEASILRGVQEGEVLGCDPEEDREGRDDPGVVASEVKERFELSPQMREACLVLRSHLGRGGAALKSKEVLSSTSFVLQHWFCISSQKRSLASEVADHLQAFAEISPALLSHVVNLSDGNGNTALHYSVSHSNFDIVRLLLETGVCNVNHQNKAGYTGLMLAALAAVEQEEDMAVIRKLFGMGNVNAKASQAGQTALMLAVSHGRQEMVEALLVSGADVNLQDEEGSTALMCACEHGRAGTVRLLLSQQNCDVSTVDNDGNDAVSIALEAGHPDIAALISTHLTPPVTGPPDSKKLPCKKRRL
ncbi:KN motif and ankyrin repeat domain-containing protein 3 isoform X2 [Pogona vitticeps]